MSGAPVIAFCAEGISHARTLLAPLDGLRERGLEIHVLTSEELRSEVEASGATFADLYAGRPIEALGDDSIPIPSRNVTFAAAHAEQIAAEVAELEPCLIVYETFCVAGAVVARLLGVPDVNVIPNHLPIPEDAIAALREDPRVSTSERCLAAAEHLRREHGMRSAGPFSYLDTFSANLNLFPEPAEFLGPARRRAFDPVECFGSLSPGRHAAAAARDRREDRVSILASLGTILWRYFEREALETLTALALECEALERVERLTVSLSGHPVDAAVREALSGPKVEVVEYVDQRAALAAFDVLITHHGLNSTHEAIFDEVPMLSCPFFGDQPALASRCQELGLALPLTKEPRGAVEPGSLGAALAGLEEDRAGFASRLAAARGWELRTIADRPRIIERMLSLAR